MPKEEVKPKAAAAPKSPKAKAAAAEPKPPKPTKAAASSDAPKPPKAAAAEPKPPKPTKAAASSDAPKPPKAAAAAEPRPPKAKSDASKATKAAAAAPKPSKAVAETTQSSMTPSVDLFNELMRDCPATGTGSSGGGSVPLREAILSAEMKLRDAARDTGMLEYRAHYVDDKSRDSINDDYVKLLATLDSHAARLDALYMYREQKCYTEVDQRRKEVVQQSKEIQDYKDRIRQLSTPDFISDDMVKIRAECITST
jgi:hypothetical protein